MPKTKPTLPIASAGPLLRFSITEFGWKEIERAYGNSLSEPVRQAIIEANENYIRWGAFEIDAELLEKARERVERVKAATAKLIHELIEDARQATDANIFADRCIRENVQNDGGSIEDDGIRSLCDGLFLFRTACARALEQFNDSGATSHRKWEHWAVWVDCKNWYPNSRTLSDDHAHRGAKDYRSVRTFAVKPRAFGAPLSGFEA